MQHFHSYVSRLHNPANDLPSDAAALRTLQSVDRIQRHRRVFLARQTASRRDTSKNPEHRLLEGAFDGFIFFYSIIFLIDVDSSWEGGRRRSHGRHSNGVIGDLWSAEHLRNRVQSARDGLRRLA